MIDKDVTLPALIEEFPIREFPAILLIGLKEHNGKYGGKMYVRTNVTQFEEFLDCLRAALGLSMTSSTTFEKVT